MIVRVPPPIDDLTFLLHGSLSKARKLQTDEQQRVARAAVNRTDDQIDAFFEVVETMWRVKQGQPPMEPAREHDPDLVRACAARAAELLPVYHELQQAWDDKAADDEPPDDER